MKVTFVPPLGRRELSREPCQRLPVLLLKRRLGLLDSLLLGVEAREANPLLFELRPDVELGRPCFVFRLPLEGPQVRGWPHGFYERSQLLQRNVALCRVPLDNASIVLLLLDHRMRLSKVVA